MRAMILAAGRGQRMRELTATTPKPLLKIGQAYLIEHSILALKKAGIVEIVINVSYHRERIIQALGNGSRYGVTITYSEEPERLETGGGIVQALPLLGNSPFIVISSDIVTDFPLQTMRHLPASTLAHLILVPNPPYHLQGDFGVSGQHIDRSVQPTYTYANVGLFDPRLFEQCKPDYFKLTDLLFPAIDAKKITGEIYHGLWYNIGTPEDLQIAQSDAALHTLLTDTPI